uniref:Chloride channel protein n=1 Tax=Palpitomonas bilix TaxID=652834 RepID=A0A7S3G1X6_9EUKA|mmetsp:Transcript_19101/g.48871  ORF Transcript_19101/g.48871 Transcript_19101/m.48871 type:complete len:834 (+) Transcript_19101:109-2610(+)
MAATTRRRKTTIIDESDKVDSMAAPAPVDLAKERRERHTVMMAASGHGGGGGGGGHHHHRTDGEKAREAAYASYDFDVQETSTYLMSRATLTKTHHLRKEIFSWVLIFLSGALTGCLAGAADVFLANMVILKFDIILLPFTDPTSDRYTGMYAPCLLFIAINFVLVTIASCFVVFVEPCSAGSGIPEIKTILNGVRLPGVLRWRTMVAKLTGVVFSAAGGLPIGKEGPMIHSGSIIAAGVSQGRFFRKKLGVFEYFRNDPDKRDFIAAGAAAGVAAAFGAPIGGVLFAVEEGASFWRQSMTWKAFFGAMVSATFLRIFTGELKPGGSSMQPYGIIQTAGSFEFGDFYQTNTAAPPTLMELPLYILLGIISGIVSGAFCVLQKHITIFRMKYIPGTKPLRRWLEAMFVAVLVGSCGAFFSAVMVPYACAPIDMEVLFFNFSNTATYQYYNATVRPFNMADIRTFYCENGTYNQAATLWFTMSESAILQLFHNEQNFNAIVLLCFFAVYWCLACITYGIAVPSGLFVPSLCTGAALGRLYGEALKLILPAFASYTGNYALLGAAGMLSGMARITISLVVIIVETTQDITYLLPTMISVLFSKFIADLFGKGLYDTHIDLKNVPMLEWEHPPEAEFVLAKHVQKTDVVVMDEVMQVADIVKTLKSTPYGAYPVVHKGPQGDLKTFVGLISRYQLTTLLELGGWTKDDEKPEPAGDEFNCAGPYRPKVTEEQLRDYYNYWPKVNQIDIPFEAYTRWLDLTPYMNPAAYTVSHVAPLSRVFRIFRYLGLRHLPVLSRGGQVMGMITRKDITEHAIEDSYWSLQEVNLELHDDSTSGRF